MANEKTKHLPDAEPKTNFRSAYSPRLRVALSFPAQGRTKQSFKAECDINNIMSRYFKTGVVDFVNKHSPQYHDVTGMDYMEAMNIVAHGNTMFNELPSKIRAEFDNDPALFLDFVNDPQNRPQMAELGLLSPEAAKALKTPADAPATANAAPAAQLKAPGSEPNPEVKKG